MRTKFFRLLFLAVIPVILATGIVSAFGEDAALSPKLQATDAAGAWTELKTAGHPPANPAKWRDTPPTTKEKEAFYLPYVRALAGKAKDFYTRFPKDANAGQAKMMEFRFLVMTTEWGDTAQAPKLEAMEKSMLKDPALSDDERMGVLQAIAQSSPPEKARPLFEEVAHGSGSAKLKEMANGQLTKMKALGNPVNLQFTAVDGRKVDMSKLKGKVVLIDFWATWCGPCVGEVPNVKKIYDQFHGKGFEIVGISLDKDKDSLTKFTAEHKMEWPQFFDGLFWQNKYAVQYGIESIPAMWLVDKKGNLRDMNAREDLNGGVQKLLAE
jgi:thiol-disulfide isomerase/thioredoxin